MVQVYGMSVVGLPDPKEYPEMMKDFSVERKEKILRYNKVQDRGQGLAAGLLLNHVLKCHGFCMDEIIYGEHGKPEIKGLFFNLSHSHDYVLCVVNEKPVGCDIEKIGDFKKKLAEHYYTTQEVDYLNGLKDEEKASEFYRIWTMKESYMKMTGEGLSLGLKRCEFRFEESVQVFQDGEKCDCHIQEYVIDGYKATVCAKENDFAETIQWINSMEK